LIVLNYKKGSSHCVSLFEINVLEVSGFDTRAFIEIIEESSGVSSPLIYLYLPMRRFVGGIYPKDHVDEVLFMIGLLNSDEKFLLDIPINIMHF
jgi:hypothetical protein